MVFKRTEETEWTRFSKPLGPKEREEREANQQASEAPAPPPPAAATPAPAPSPAPAAAPGSPASPSYRPSAADVNVTVAARAPARGPDTSDDVESVIGEHSFFNGTFRSENSLRISGTVEGEVQSARLIFIEEQAKVTAKVKGAGVFVAGQVDGQIYSHGRVELKPSGRVTGEITYGTLVMQEGAYFEGQLRRAREGETFDGTAPASERPAHGGRR